MKKNMMKETVLLSAVSLFLASTSVHAFPTSETLTREGARLLECRSEDGQVTVDVYKLSPRIFKFVFNSQFDQRNMVVQEPKAKFVPFTTGFHFTYADQKRFVNYNISFEAAANRFNSRATAKIDFVNGKHSPIHSELVCRAFF